MHGLRDWGDEDVSTEATLRRTGISAWSLHGVSSVPPLGAPGPVLRAPAYFSLQFPHRILTIIAQR